MKIFRKIAIYWCACLLLLSVSCTYHNNYPQSWALQNTVGEDLCADLSGIYINFASNSTSQCLHVDTYVVKKCLLSEIFSKKKKGPKTVRKDNVALTEKIEIEHTTSDTITTKLFAEGRELHDQTLSKKDGDFECHPEGIMIKYPVNWEGPNDGLPAIAAEKRTIFVAKSSDGALVLKEIITTSGLAVIVPIITSGSHWYRWLPAELP